VVDGHSHGGDGADAEPLHGGGVGVGRARLITDWSVVVHLSQFCDSCCLGRRGVHRDRAACATVDGAPCPLGWNGGERGLWRMGALGLWITVRPWFHCNCRCNLNEYVAGRFIRLCPVTTNQAWAMRAMPMGKIASQVLI
jgi:hypothetical protein